MGCGNAEQRRRPTEVGAMTAVVSDTTLLIVLHGQTRLDLFGICFESVLVSLSVLRGAQPAAPGGREEGSRRSEAARRSGAVSC
jgi:hypothetical protein